MKVRAGFLALLLILLAPVSSAQEGTARDSGNPLLTVGNPSDLQVNAERLHAAALMVQHAPTTVTLISIRSGRTCCHEVSASRPDYIFNFAGFFIVF